MKYLKLNDLLLKRVTEEINMIQLVIVQNLIDKLIF